MPSKEDFIEFCNKKTGKGHTLNDKNIKKGLKIKDKQSFDGSFDMYYWAMKLQKPKYQKYTYKEMVNDNKVDLTEQKLEKIKENNEIELTEKQLKIIKQKGEIPENIDDL